MPGNKEDSRQDDRRKLIFYLEVFDRDSGQMIGRLVDIHVAGMLLVSDRRCQEGLELNLRIMTGNNLLETVPEDLEVTAGVRWSRKDVNPDYYVTGLQFLEVSPHQEKMIWELIRSLSFHE